MVISISFVYFYAPPYMRHYTIVLGSVCLEEHRPGLRRDDGDEAEHEVHFRAHLGDVELVLADEGRVDRGYEVDDRRDTVGLPDVGLAEEARLWTATGE